MHSLHILAIGSLATLGISCGKWARTSDQRVEALTVPAYPQISDDVFSLTSKKPDTTYRTTMLIINEGADPVLLGEVINASVYSREVFASARRFENEHDFKELYSDSGLELKAVEMMKKDLSTFELRELQKNPMTVEERKVNIKGWLESELNSLPLDQGQRNEFNAAWGAYCEAKIIEWAANSNFAASRYQELPSPQMLCSDYYASAGLLQGASCQNPRSGNYFSCLWKEGVAKTRWFQDLTPPAPSSAPEELATWSTQRDEMVKKQALLEELLTTSIDGFQKVLALDPSKVSINSNPVKNKVNSNFFVSIFTQQLAKEPGNNVTWCSVPPFGIKDRSLSGICTLFGMAAVEPSPATWIDAFEGRSEGDIAFTFPATSENGRPSFQQFLRYLGERDKGRTSEGDRLFHQVLQSPKPMETPSFDSAGEEFKSQLEMLRSQLAQVLYGSLDEDARAEKESRMRNIEYREAKIAEMQSEMRAIELQTEEALNRGLKATNAPGVAHGFLDVRFHFKQVGSILTGEFWQKDTEEGGVPKGIFRGCFDLIAKQSIPCPEDLAIEDREETQVFRAELNRDAKTGQINMAMIVDEPDTVGLAAKPRAKAEDGETLSYFMDLDSSTFKGRRLRFELYPNRLEESLDILTGRVFIEEGTKILYEGGISGWELWN